jgi:Patatin-like phospholipase
MLDPETVSPRPSHPWRLAILSFLGGALSIILLLAVAYLGIRRFEASGRLPERPTRPDAELAARLAADVKNAAEDNRSDIEHHVRTLYARQQHDPDATLDFLLLSGGGDRGAFGAGFLLGWTTVPPGANALPKFDGVSGVSAGSFIAPFAFLGTQGDYETIDRLFRNPEPDWVARRGLFFFLPENSSFADVPGLARDLRSQVDVHFAGRIARAGADGRRVLLIQATDMDSGTFRVFDAVAAAREAVEHNNAEILSDILLASSAIPGAFPPREIEGRLYADGGIASNFFYGGPMPERDTFGATWRREHPDAPVPKTRYWVIINEYIQPLPVTVQPTWPAIVERSIYVSVRSAEAIALRHLYALAEATRLRGDGTVEVRWIAVPQTWKPLNDTPFDRATMRLLADEGRRLGTDPASWMTTAP